MPAAKEQAEQASQKLGASGLNANKAMSISAVPEGCSGRLGSLRLLPLCLLDKSSLIYPSLLRKGMRVL